MVGDSVWDLKAAARAHIRSIGMLSGGVGPAELRDAGAVGAVRGPGRPARAPRRAALRAAAAE